MIKKLIVLVFLLIHSSVALADSDLDYYRSILHSFGEDLNKLAEEYKTIDMSVQDKEKSTFTGYSFINDGAPPIVWLSVSIMQVDIPLFLLYEDGVFVWFDGVKDNGYKKLLTESVVSIEEGDTDSEMLFGPYLKIQLSKEACSDFIDFILNEGIFEDHGSHREMQILGTGGSTLMMSFEGKGLVLRTQIDLYGGGRYSLNEESGILYYTSGTKFRDEIQTPEYPHKITGEYQKFWDTYFSVKSELVSLIPEGSTNEIESLGMFSSLDYVYKVRTECRFEEGVSKEVIMDKIDSKNRKGNDDKKSLE